MKKDIAKIRVWPSTEKKCPGHVSFETFSK